MTWPDWALLLLVLAFAFGGLVRGAVAQVFGVLGALTGGWAALIVLGWVGAHWRGAQPAIVFVTLRWLVAVLSGFAVAAVFQWWGWRVAKAIHEGPLGWLDRSAGFAFGAVLGATVGAFLLLAALTIRYPSEPGRAVARARSAAPAMEAAATACAFGERYYPGCGWLKQRFLAARRRVARLRANEAGAKSI